MISLKAACEVCGAPLKTAPNRVEIDGAIMLVCNACTRLGKVVGGSPVAVVRRPHENRLQSTFKSISSSESEFEVDPDYNVRIRQAREKMGLSQDQLGMMLNEKLSVIRMLETKKLKPDVILTRKLMHHLKINLLVSLSDLEGSKQSS
jgi:putative transcription factor